MPRLRRRKRFGELAPGLWQGPMPLDDRDLQELLDAGVTRVLNLCEEDEYDPGVHDEVRAALREIGAEESTLPSLDHGNLLPGLVERAVREINGWREQGEVVLVHCFAGQERSAAVAAAALAAESGEGPVQALRRVRRAQRAARPQAHQIADLERWWAARTRGEGDGEPETG